MLLPAILDNRPLRIAHLFRGGEAGAWYEFEPEQLSQTSDGATPVTALDNPVGFVLDKSPNGNTISQAPDTTRPFYKNAGGRHNILFDGSNDYLFRTSSLGLYAAGACSIFFCTSHPSVANTKYMGNEGNSASANSFYGLRTGTPNTSLAVAAVNDAGTTLLGTVTVAALAFAVGIVKVIGLVDDGANITGYINGVPQTTVAYTRSGVMTLNRFAIGTLVRSTVAGWINMNLFAWLGIGRVMTPREIAGLTRNFALKGGGI